MKHTWKIYELNRNITDGVVNKVKFACISYISSGSKYYSKRKVGDIEISGSSTDENFVPYENLTEDDVLAWVTSSIDYTSYETWNSASLASTLLEISNVTETTGKPWD